MAISAVMGKTLATPRTPSVPKSLGCIGSVMSGRLLSPRSLCLGQTSAALQFVSRSVPLLRRRSASTAEPRSTVAREANRVAHRQRVAGLGHVVHAHHVHRALGGQG